MQVMLPPVHDGLNYATLENAYNLAQSALSGYIAQVHASWHSTVNAGVSKDLDCKLLDANPAEGGLLTCNFNKTALTMFQEVCATTPLPLLPAHARCWGWSTQPPL
jgi:hypothetical protein